MLDTATKRRIDTARDILVGKVPDPKSQVEQITIALIYKFMDDMDLEAEELGGFRKFFAGDYARYGWARLMRSGLGGHETLNLYAEAIARMPENPGIPPLFRDIFKNAYLPYRDPETLRAFLKIIDEFAYDHSERLGDAFEYLLSVLGSQGDAGQFRTPRHIIDFIVEVLDPQKHETVLDPACGTAGFLISAWKHILKQNSSPRPLAGDDCMDAGGRAMPGVIAEGPGERAGDLLTPDERGRLARNFKGYDISPDMVRLSLVNLYLHGFTDPHIVEYDTLTSQERWNETADIILANPPFMSPKGGIRPHNRFSVQSKRSEVLFVDYMAEHLTPSGRAGIIVPEGIIFQSQGAYTQLRKMLVEEHLIAVVSLPAGVFQPYSGVKTSILILDKSLARSSDRIAFFKVQNDGFGLGAQRRAIDKNDLPAAAAALQAFRHSRPRSESRAGAGGNPGDAANQTFRHSRAACVVGASAPYNHGVPLAGASGNLADFDPTHYPGLLVVEKTRIAANGDYNLSGERYREGVARASFFPNVPLGEVCDLIGGATPSKQDQSYWTNGSVKWISSKHIDERGVITAYELISKKAVEETSTRVAPRGSTIIITRVSVGKFAFADDDYAINQDLTALVSKDNERLDPEFIRVAAHHIADVVERNAVGIGVRGVTRNFLAELEIPLPPLEVQKEIVEEIEGYQKVIDGARAVLDNYRPHIPIHPDWPKRNLGSLAENLDSRRVPITKGVRKAGPYPYYGASGIVDYVADFIFNEEILLISEDGANLLARSTPIAFSVSGKCWVNNHAHVLKFAHPATQKFVEVYLNSISIEEFVTGAAQPKVNQEALNRIPIPIPDDVSSQQAIIAEIEAEKTLVAANRELIARFEQKIQATLARVWGEDDPPPAEA